MKRLFILLLFINFFSCEKKQPPLENKKKSVITEKPKIVSVAIEDVITTLTIENRELLISQLGKPHKHNDFVTIETSKKDSPIIIIFEDIKGKHSYTGSQTSYNKHNEKRQYFFTTLTESQLKKLKETGESGWKD